MSQADQLRVPEPVRTDPRSFELLRVWVANQDQHISLRLGVWHDPGAWGALLADLARHIASAFEKFEDYDALRALEGIRAGFDAEILSPALPVTLSPAPGGDASHQDCSPRPHG